MASSSIGVRDASGLHSYKFGKLRPGPQFSDAMEAFRGIGSVKRTAVNTEAKLTALTSMVTHAVAAAESEVAEVNNSLGLTKKKRWDDDGNVTATS